MNRKGVLKVSEYQGAVKEYYEINFLAEFTHLQACPKQGFEKAGLRLEYGCYKQF